MKVEQTKGTFRLNGKSNVEKINTKDFGWIKKTNLSIKTLKDNFVSVTIEEKNGKGMDVAVKNAGDEKSEKYNVTKIVDKLKDTFTNDDMLFVMGVTEYDTYRKEFILKPTGVYHSDKKYEGDDFEETNFIEQQVIFNEYNNGKAKLNVVSYFGEISEVEMKVSDELKEDFEKFKTGDLLKVVFSVVNRPIYKEDTSSSSGFTPKGKGVNKNNNGKKTIDGYESFNIIVGLEDVQSGLYTRKDLRDQQEEFERKQEEYKASKSATTETNNESDEEDDDLPF